MLPKTPRTCELEEYARRYEAMQRGNASRRRVSQAQADPAANRSDIIPSWLVSHLSNRFHTVN